MLFLKEIAFTPDFLINDYYIEFLKNNHAKTFQRIKKEGNLEQLPEQLSELHNLTGIVEGEISEDLHNKITGAD